MVERSGGRFAEWNAALAGGPGAALWRASNLWRRRQKAMLDSFGLTPVQFLLLSGLAESTRRDRPVTQADLARRCGADAMMVSQVLRQLERARLVRRDSHPGDSRAFALMPTAKGRALAQRAAPAVERSETAFFATLGPDAEAFVGALRLLAGEKPRRRVKAGHRV
jgi:DNA-binding MarR family transcriptional regulator